jgi:hypothetical protein
MGGYAAVRFADAVGADGVLALSPQWSINPSRARWENRWPDDSPRIRWIEAIDGSVQCQAKPILIYDPHLPLDGRHAANIAAETPSVLVPVPYSGHPSAPCLNETGLLRQLIEHTRMIILMLKLLPRKFGLVDLEARFIFAHWQSGNRLSRPRTALALARAGCALYPNNAFAMLSLAYILARTGEHAEALMLHREIVSKRAIAQLSRSIFGSSFTRR